MVAQAISMRIGHQISRIGHLVRYIGSRMSYRTSDMK